MGYCQDSLVHHFQGDLDTAFVLGHHQDMVASLCNLVEDKVDFVHYPCWQDPKQQDHLGRVVHVDCYQTVPILGQDIFDF